MTSTFAPTSSASAVKSVDPSTDFILKNLFNITMKSSKKIYYKAHPGYVNKETYAYFVSC